MVLKFVEKFVRKTKNPNFRFDAQVRLGDVIDLLTTKCIAGLKGFISFPSLRKRIYIGRRVQLKSKNNIHLGNTVNIGDYCYISGLGGKGVRIGNRSSIDAFSRIVVSHNWAQLGEGIIIGDDVGISSFATIGGAGLVQIGDECIIGQYLSIHPENHIFSLTEVPIRNQGVTRKGVTIGNNNWIGAKVTILDGSIIGNNCVIAAGAVVNGVFPDNVVIGGIPAKILKKIHDD